MAGIGDSWGTREELLHPRGPDGKWIRKGGIAKSIIDGVLGFLAGFRPRTFQNRGQASQYLQNIAHRQGARRMGRVDQVRLARDLGPANADLRDGVIDEPSTKRFVDMMDRSATELPDDAILTRIVGPDAFGFTPQTAQGTNSDTDPGIRGMSGKLIADRGYGLTSIGGVQGTPPAGSVRMVIAAKKGTKVTIPAASPSDTTVFLERGQPMRVTKVEPDGVGGWTMYVTAEPGGSGREVPESIAGPVGAGRESSKDREARIRDTMQSLAKLDKTPDEQKEQEDEAARAARAAEAAKVTPVPSPQQEAERRRLEVAQQQQAPRQPAPGEPPPRTEPVVGRVGEPGTGVPPQAAPAPGTPEPTTAPRRVVDIRTAVRDAGIPSPSSGPELRQWNEAYLGLKSGKTEPDEAARNLDANIRHNRGLAEDLRSRPGNEARITDLEENIKAQEGLRDLIREQYDLPAPATEAPPAPTPVKKAPAAPAVKRTAGGLPKQEGLTPVKKAAPRKSAADRDVAARDTAKSWLEAAGVSESDLGDMDRTGVAVVSDLVARRRISKAEAVRRLRTDREGSLLNRIADAIEASSRKKAAKKAAPAKKAPAKKAVPRPAAEKPGDDLDKMTKADLIAEAGRRGVTARQSWTKDRIKKAIRDREEAGAQAPEAPTPVKKATKKAAPALSDQETQIRELFEGDKPTVVQLREYARINGMEPSDAVVSQGFMKPLSRMKREELIGLILTGNESGRRFTGDRSVGRLPNASTLRQQIIATPEGNRGDMLDGVLAPLTQPQRRRLAKELGVRGQDRATNQGQILDAIREHFRGAVPEGAEAPAPVKKAAKAAVPGAVPGRIDRVGPRDINVGDEILIEAGPSKGASRGRVARIERSGKTGNNNRYQFFNEDGEMFRSMAPNGKTSVRRGGAPDREQAARDRQARIDRARSYGDVAAEIEELISGEVDNDVLVRGILRVGRGLPPEDLDQLVRAARSGNTNDVRLRMGNLLQAQGVNLFDRPGAIERFDRRRHELLGDDIPEGSMVHVVRPGVESTVDGEHLWLRKATVEVATPQETVREERAKRLVPEGSTQGARTDVPVDNALRKRELRKALMEADLPPASPGSARKAQQEIKDDLIGGRLTPEEAIRRLESEVEFLTEDANEVDANLRQTDLTDDERGKLLRHKAQLEASVESNKKHSEFLRKYFKGEGPVVSLEEAKVQDPVSYEFLKDATPDDLREAAKGAGLDAPSGDTPDEMFRDLIKQVAKKELDRRAAKKAAKKVPAKKVAKKAAPEVPRDKERVDARLLAEGLGLQDDGIVDMAQRALDGESVSGTPKNPTPRQIADMVDGHARHLSDSTAIRYGNWFDRSQPSSPNYDPEFAEETRRNFESGMARAQALRDFAERIRGVRRKKATPAKAATPEVAKLQDKVDDLEKRRIDDALKELTGAKSKEQRDAALEGLTLPELRRLAEQAGVGHARTWRSKLGVREGIIAHFFPETPTPVPGDRDAVARRLGIDPGESGAQGRLLDRVVDGEITEDQARQILSTSVAEQMGATGPQQGGNVLRQPNMPLSRRASGAGIQTPGRMFSDVDSAVTDADVRLRNGESHTDVARRLRERAARVAKADIMEEGRRFPTELDRDTLLSIRKSNADYLRRVATHVQQEGKATKATPAKKAAKKAAPRPDQDLGRQVQLLARGTTREERAGTDVPSASRTGTSPVGGTKSTTPEIPNNWGALGTGGDVEFHDDGVIGQRLRQMGDDRLMDVDGEPLSNVIGKLATRAIRGQISQEQLLMDLDRIYKRLPAGSRAKGQVKSMMEDLDAPARAMPDLPDGTPAPFRTAMERLLQIPVARDAVDRPGFHRSREDSEVDKLLKLIEEFQEGRTGGLRMIDEIQEMRRSLPHESQEGRFEADRVLRQLHDDLDALFKNPDTRSQVMRRTPGAPPTAKKATPRLTAIPGEGTGRRRGGTRPTLRVVRNEDGEFSLVLVH